MLMCHTPSVKMGLDVTPSPDLTSWPWKKTHKNNVAMFNWYYWSKYSPNGGVQWLLVHCLNLLYQEMCAVAYRRIAMAIRLAGKVGVCFIVVVMYVNPVAAGKTQSKYSPNSSVQWLLPKPWTPSIGRCTRYCHGASAGPSKWLAK